VARESRIFIVGSGVVGTATGEGLRSAGHELTFVDISRRRVQELRDRGLDARTELELAEEPPSFIFLTLPTPNVGLQYDLSMFSEGTSAVGRALRTAQNRHTVVVRSTVPPGTTEGLVQPLLEEQSGKTLGMGFALAAAPEFLRSASAAEDFRHPWMTVIASRSARTVARMRELLAPFGGDVRTFSDPASAELVKCAHNLFNATKISFWNEIWLVAQRLGVEADPIAAAVAKSAEGSTNPHYGIRGGAPFGGMCLPKDTCGFLGFAAGIGLDVPLLRAVVEVNDRMRQLVGEETGSARGRAAAGGAEML
jgi:UDPglucose 6-dehydrogenase